MAVYTTILPRLAQPAPQYVAFDLPVVGELLNAALAWQYGCHEANSA
jgi:hypothetical protein